MMIVDDDDQITDLDMGDYWNEEGSLTFHVLSYDPNAKYYPYELEEEEWTGCVGGLLETIGLDYAIHDGVLDVGKLHIGMTYELTGITVTYTRGDGFSTDDDCDYYVKSVKKVFYPHRFLKAWWWHLIGWRIRKWRNR